MEYITDADYKHVKGIWKDFQTNHDLYVQSDILLNADLFKSFRKKMYC